MIRSLQKRFVVAAMLSLLLLLGIILLGVFGISLAAIEKSTDRMLDALTEDIRGELRTGSLPQAILSVEVGAVPTSTEGNDTLPANSSLPSHFIVTVADDGSITDLDKRFLPGIEEDEVDELIEKVMREDRSRGRTGFMKYSVTPLDGGEYRLVFVDYSLQMITVFGALTAFCVMGFFCLLLMLLILLIVSKKAVKPIADGIEKQRRFVADAGHEINTPLSIIQANTEALELRYGESKWSQNIKDQVVRLAGMTGQLLALSRLDETDVALAREEVAMSGLLEAAVESFDERAEARKIKIETDITPNIIIQGNQQALQQLVSVLLDNALKYADEESLVKISLFANNRSLELMVSNTCSSLPSVAPSTLFDRYYRGNDARTQSSGGYGIGLSIAQNVATLHKGSIGAYFDGAHQIRFVVNLPL